MINGGQKAMKKYIKPEIIEIKIDAKDIITASNYLSANIDGGSAKFMDSWKDNASW